MILKNTLDTSRDIQIQFCFQTKYLPRKGQLTQYTQETALTRIARNTVEPIPSATSYSPFSLGRVKLCSLPDPNIL